VRVWVVLVVSACGRVGFDPLGDGTSGDAAPVMFADNFQRADGPLGNGWTEKTPNTFAISSNLVVRTDFSNDYRDLFVSRPANEDQLDATVTMQFTVGHLPPGYPQIHVRVQRTTIATSNTLDGYLLYIDGVAGNGLVQADVTRQHGTVLPTPLATFPLSPPLAQGQTYRLRLSVRGTAPVQLDAAVDLVTGPTFTMIGGIQMLDSDPTAVVDAGAVGFDAGQPEAANYYTYDEFTYVAL
jgi:hypothetical protein